MSWDVGSDILSMPSVILVKFNGYTGPVFSDCGDQIILVYPVNWQFDFKGVNCSRTQFPLWLAYAIIVHKCQRMLLSAAVINLSQKEHCLGLSYVAVSCVRTISGIVFEKPFDFDHFKHKKSDISQDRELDFVFRSNQLL
jgi:ATP-dependent DNA helicase PIF1